MAFAQIIPSLDMLMFFTLIFTRLTATIFTLPVFGAESIPVRFKVGLGIMISVMVVVFIQPDTSVMNKGGGALVLALMGEAVLGLALGLMVRIVIEAVNLGATIMGFQMGFAIVNVVDPQTGGQVSLVASFQGLYAAMIFIVTGLYRVFLRGLLDSFTTVPPGMIVLKAGLGQFIYQAGGQMFISAVRIAAPVMVCLLITKIALGIVARTVPQMNIFIVGFPLTIGLGLLLLGLSLPYITATTIYAFEESADLYNGLIQAVAP